MSDVHRRALEEWACRCMHLAASAAAAIARGDLPGARNLVSTLRIMRNRPPSQAEAEHLFEAKRSLAEFDD